MNNVAVHRVVPLNPLDERNLFGIVLARTYARRLRGRSRAATAICLASFPLAATVLIRSAIAVAAADITLDATLRQDVLYDLAGKLESDYAIPDTAKRLARFVRAKAQTDAYQNITSGPALAHALTNDLYTVAHDKHLHVEFTSAPLSQPDNKPPVDFLELVRQSNGMIPTVEIFDGNVGYMRVNGVPPLPAVREAVAAAFAFLHRTAALIIDNRSNGGGDPNTVALYMSYLSEGAPYLVNSFHWRAGNRTEEFWTTNLGDLSYGAHKPVYILDSSSTFSGGEELAYDIQAFKRGTVVGEVTGGGANPGGPEVLKHQFVVNMPGGRAVNAVTGTSWEGVGVKPDVATPAALAVNKAHALAIQRLMSSAESLALRTGLEAIAIKLEAAANETSGSTPHLANDQVGGSYSHPGGSDAAMVIWEENGQLVQRVSGFPDTTLVPLKGNSYSLRSLPEGFQTTFVAKGDKLYLILETPVGLPTLGEKTAVGHSQ